MFCRKCGAEFPDNGKFCPICGIRQESPNEDVYNDKSANVDEIYTPKTHSKSVLNPAFFILFVPLAVFILFIGKGIYDFLTDHNITLQNYKERQEEINEISDMFGDWLSKNPSNERNNSKVNNPKVNQTINVTLDELVNAYRTNRATADAKYKNKNVVITGKIVAIVQNPHRITFEVDLWNFPVDDFLQGGLLGTIYSIVMVFDNQYANHLSNRYTGEVVTVEGRFMGLNEFNNLEMHNCKIK